jgi:hypothetical protein
MRPTTHLLASLAMTAAAVGCAFMMPVQAAAAAGFTVIADDDGDDDSAGGGRASAAPRVIGAFSKLRIEGSIDVYAHPGAHPGVIVHASKNIEPLVETVVEGDTLVVRMKRNVNVITFGHDDTRVDVEFAQLTATQQRGSGDLHIRGLEAPRLESSIAGSGDLKMENAQLGSFALRIDGSGDVAVEGKADEAKFSIDGSGDIAAERLVARRVEVAIRGSGDARVNATEALDARVAGSGDIVYRGHPHQVSRDVAGSGSVSAAD